MSKEIYNIVSLEEVFSNIDPTKDLAFDTETETKYGVIRLAQFYQKHWDQALIVERPDPLQLIINFNNIPQCNIIMQYASYDISTLQEQTGSRWVPETFNDTFLLARLAFPHLNKYTLDELITVAIGRDPYQEAGINKADMHKANWKALVLDPKQVLYSALDVYYLLDLYDKVRGQEPALNYRLDISSLRIALDFQRNGFPVDKQRLTEQYQENIDKIAELALPINCNSWKQVRPYIGSDQSDDIGLARLSLQGNERAVQVRKTRKLTKQNSFINKFDTDDGMIYGHFSPSTRSGRFSCDEQNLQQLPRKLKKVFGYTPEEGRAMLYSDYSGLELRCIAAITGDEKLLELLYNGVDVHNYVAEFIFGKDFTKTQRQVAKTCNFNLLYAGGAGMLQNILIKEANIWLEIEEITIIKRKWLSLFKGIARWQQKGIRDYQAHRLGSTPFGRRYVGNMMTDQLNIENQGFGSEIAKLAMHRMYPKIKTAWTDFNLWLMNFIHDSYLLGIDLVGDVYKDVAKHVGDCMHAAWVEGCKVDAVRIKDIPMPVNVYVGYNWGDIENGDYFYEYKTG